MALPNIFTQEQTEKILDRISQLTPETNGLFGKMTVAQMLAHCNVTYEMVYENKHQAANRFVQFLLKLFVKRTVVNEIPYKQNGKTAPQFLIKDIKNFEEEKQKLINYITKTQALGEAHFDQKHSHSFGKLSASEWNNMFYKHLNHHLKQFAV